MAVVSGWWPVEIDRPWGADAPPVVADHVYHSDNADRSDAGETARDARGTDADRAEYRALVDAVYQAAARERWEAAKPAFRVEWTEHKQKHPAPPDDSPAIDEPARRHVEAGCRRIRETEEHTVTPAMLRIEAADQDRHLAGLEHRRKGEDRIMEKVAAALEEQPNLTPDGALASVKDAIRYTFQYTEDRYTDGVRADVGRLQAAGFEPVELRNSWREEEYKGVNSRWRVPENGQLFEVQFHTKISFEAKQLTHEAYERIRNPVTADAELRDLRKFQRDVCAVVPTPPRSEEVPDIHRRS